MTNSTSPSTTPAAKPTPASQSSRNTYTNSTEGISLSIPQGWTAEEGHNPANATLLTVVTLLPPIALDRLCRNHRLL